MNFEFNEEQQLVRDQARGFLNTNCQTSVVRRVLEGNELYAQDLWKQIAELGWTATTIPEEYGGIGLSYFELALIAEELGRACAPLPFASSVYLATEAILSVGSEAQKLEWLPKLAAGEVIGTLAYSEGPGEARPEKINTTVSNGSLSGVKRAVPGGDIASVICVLGQSLQGNGTSMYLVSTESDRVTTNTIKTIDPSLNYADISFENAHCELLGEDGNGWEILQQVLDRAAVLYAWEQLGGAESSLEMARNYSLERYAFGRPIGSFQAIKHKLAEMFVKNTLARSNAYYGAWALSTNAKELPLAAATARIGSSQAYYYASKENIQTHGGMGYTWEFDCQFFYRRSKALAIAVGSERSWQDKLINASDIAAA
ncbi:acyl-CoA dehydrogenase [Halioglobus maricola]|uniref:Acyl-CoA dehydrogenase n=1 Tax=Halioglobus maricola TaxID=2601894 RepID=A0A5P9NK76_9GAMM|nr:acyl-CoA dehydrogenase family protein [Halioglobus maricola]QFU75378.1 acyl-CoA dehydrogenase [Halioglobus maricola]